MFDEAVLPTKLFSTFLAIMFPPHMYCLEVLIKVAFLSCCKLTLFAEIFNFLLNYLLMSNQAVLLSNTGSLFSNVKSSVD